MRDPHTATPFSLDDVPDRPAVFLLWAAEGAPYLAKTALLRRRLRRVLARGDQISRVLRLGGVIERIEYWLTGSQLESMLLHLELAQRYFPEDWRKITRLRPPAFVRLTTANPFPRTMVTTRLGRGLFHGPFPSRAAAERFEAQLLDLFQLRRCEENLDPSPAHPGCIYGEMNRCLRPCQQAVTAGEYAGEAQRVERFLTTGGSSLAEAAESARDRASAALDFEEAERLHQRLHRIGEVRVSAGPLARTLDQLAGVAVVPSAEPGAVELLFLGGGRWYPPARFPVGETAEPSLSEPPGDAQAGSGDAQPAPQPTGPAATRTLATKTMDRRLRDLFESLDPPGPPNLEHLSILMRWHNSSWRDGEWIGFDSSTRVPYRRIVNAIGRVAGGKPSP